MSWARFFEHAIGRELATNFMGELQEIETSLRFRTDFRKYTDRYEIHCDLPGVEKNNINVDIENRFLTISGHRTNDADCEYYYEKERVYGEFERSFELPEDCVESKVSATYNNGVLVVVVPRAEKSTPPVQKIQIQ